MPGPMTGAASSILLIADPGAPAVIAERLSDSLPSALTDCAAPDGKWDVSVRRDTCCGRTGQLCDALEGGAARSCHLRTGDHPAGCRRGEAVGVIDVADRFHRSLHHRQREHGADDGLAARIRLAGG